LTADPSATPGVPVGLCGVDAGRAVFFEENRIQFRGECRAVGTPGSPGVLMNKVGRMMFSNSESRAQDFILGYFRPSLTGLVSLVDAKPST